MNIVEYSRKGEYIHGIETDFMTAIKAFHTGKIIAGVDKFGNVYTYEPTIRKYENWKDKDYRGYPLEANRGILQVPLYSGQILQDKWYIRQD